MSDEELMHYGVKGMRWGVRKAAKEAEKRASAARAQSLTDKKKKALSKLSGVDDKLARRDDVDYKKLRSGKLSEKQYDKNRAKDSAEWETASAVYREVARSVRREKRTVSNNTRGEKIVKALFMSNPFSSAANEYLTNNPPEKSWKRAVAKIYTGDPREWADIVRGDYR